MPGPIVSRPLLRSIVAIVTTLGAVAVGGLMTFGLGATFKFTDQTPKGVLFIDQSQVATTTPSFTYTTTTDTVALQNLTINGMCTGCASVSATPTLHQVTTVGSTTTNSISVGYIVGSSSDTSVFAGPVSTTILRVGSVIVGGSVTSTSYAGSAGSLALPTFNFANNGDGNSGIFQGSINQVDIAANGVRYAKFAAGGVILGDNTTPILPFTDGDTDIGNSSTFRFDNGFFTGQLTSGSVTTTNATTTGAVYLLNLPAASAGRNPLCQEADGRISIGAAGVCPVSAFSVKENLRSMEYGLPEILETNFYDYSRKDLKDGRTYSGPVADWLKASMPNLVIERDGGVIGYDTNSMLGVLGQSIKDLNAKVEAQQSEINELNARLVRLENRVGLLERLVNWLQSLFKT